MLFRTESVKNFTITGNLLPSLRLKMPRKKSIKTETDPSSDIPLLYNPIIQQLYVSLDLFIMFIMFLSSSFIHTFILFYRVLLV